MGTTSTKSIEQENKFLERAKNSIEKHQKKEEKEEKKLPLSLFLLSLTKIKEIKTFFQKYQEKIENNKDVKLLQILNNLNKSTKLINDLTNSFAKHFSHLKKLPDQSLYEYILIHLNKEIKIIEDKVSNFSLTELFFFNIKKTCKECNSTKDNINTLLLDNKMLDFVQENYCMTCHQCQKETTHIVNVNEKPKIIISVNKKLITNSIYEKYVTEKYVLICTIQSKALIYKTFSNFYKYNIENNSYQKIDEINNSGLVDFYRIKGNNNENEDNAKINSFFNISEIKTAIINYLSLKKENNIKENMYLINKEFFDYLLLMNNIDLNFNNFEALDGILYNNQLEIMNMNKLIIYDEPSKILGDIDFIDEKILKNLGYKPSDYLGKNARIIQYQNYPLYEIIFQNNSRIKLFIRNGEQIISFLGNIETQPENNKIDNNISEKNKISNNNINNLQIDDKNEKNIKEKICIIRSNLEKIFNNINNINSLINNHIVGEIKFEEYLIISKKSYNRITKIFESDGIYENENINISDISNITNFESLDKNILIQKYNLYDNRKKILKDKNLFKADFEDIKIGGEKTIYPKDFVLIKKDIIIELVSNLGINIPEIKNQIYNILLGEKYAFIKDNFKNKNIFFICKSCNKTIFNVEMIIKYKNKDDFGKEIDRHIKQQGLENYLKIREINFIKKCQDLLNLEGDIIGEIMILMSSYTLIEGLFIALSKINDLNNYFQNYNKNEKNLSDLFSNYIKNSNENLSLVRQFNLTKEMKLKKSISEKKTKMNEIILEAEKKLNQLQNNKLNSLNFKELIKLILTTLDNELNIKKNEDKIKIETFDKTFGINKFNEMILKKNDSIIYNLFFGTKKVICNYKECRVEKFIYKLFKFFYFKIDKDSPNDIISLINLYENKKQNLKGNCNLCAKSDEEYIKSKNICEYPEILTIIIDNENNKKIDTKPSFTLKNYEFKLISCIIKSKNFNDLNIIYKENSKYFVFDGNEDKDAKENINDLISNPCVLFYEKNNMNNFENKVIIEEKDEEISQATFLNNQMGELDNIENNNLINTNVMIQKSLNEMQNNNVDTIIYQNPFYQKEDNQNFKFNNKNNENNFNNNTNNNINNVNVNYNQNNNINNNGIQVQNSNMYKSYNFGNNMNNINNMNNMNPLNIKNNMNRFNFNNNANQMNINKSFNPNFNQNMANSFNQINNFQFNNGMNQNKNIQNNIFNNNIINNNNIMNPQFNNMKNNFNNQNIFINQNNNNLNNNFGNNNNMIFNNMNKNMNWNNNINNNAINNNLMNNNLMNNNIINNMNNNIINNHIINNNMNSQMININMNNNMNNNMMNNNVLNNNIINQNNFNKFNNSNQINSGNEQINNGFQNNNQNNNQISNNNIQVLNQNNNIDLNKSIKNSLQIMNNQNNNNMNFNNNIKEENNNQVNDNNININNNIENLDDKTIPPENRDEITIYFDFKNEKQIYIDINKNTKFYEVVNQLKEKYEWLYSVKIKSFVYNNKELEFGKTCEENGIKDSALISIIIEE